MESFEEMLEQLNNGYVFEFMYMDKQHKVMSFDKTTYTVIKYTNDNKSNREERKIVKSEVLKEMYKDMTNITYSY